MINADLKKVRSILDESVKYIVPEYQRNFEWKREQAEEFWEDISSGSVFLGNLVLDISKQKENEIYIVDGQQRITTIFIFLAACRCHAMNIKSYDQANAIQTKISFIDDTSGKAGSSKLIPSPSIVDVFAETIANSSWDGKKFESKGKKRQVNKIKPIYEYFLECISDLGADDLAALLKKLYESSFVRIEIEEAQEAFEIFERTNARGMELNAADLLKNYLFAQNASEKLTDDWDEIVENSLGTMLRMIKYYYVSHSGLIQKKLLFKALKKHGEKIGAESMLSDIKSFSYHYAIAVNGSAEGILEWASQTNNSYFRKEYNAKSLNRKFEALQLFSVTQAYPLIVKLMIILSEVKSPQKKNKISEKFLEFINTLENFHFINYAISQRPGNQIENYYADMCTNKINEDNIIETMKSVTSELKKNKLAGKEEFTERFSEISYINDSYIIYYLFDRFNNFGRKGGQYIELYNPDKKLLRRNYDIDHLISQNLDNYDFDGGLIVESIDNIGNLLVISKHTNGKVQNMEILEKMKVFEEMEIQNLPEVKQLVTDWKSKKFDKEDLVVTIIKERAQSLAQRAYDKIWNF